MLRNFMIFSWYMDSVVSRVSTASAPNVPRSINTSNRVLRFRHKFRKILSFGVDLLLPRNLLGNPPLLLLQFRGKVLPEIRSLEHGTNLHLSAPAKRSPLQPLHSLVHRPHLPQPIARDQLLRF